MEKNKYQTVQFLPELSLFEIQQRIFIQKTSFEMIMSQKHRNDRVEINTNEEKKEDKVFYE